MMEQSPFKMDTFPNLFSGRDGIVDTVDPEIEAETDAEQPISVIGERVNEVFV